MSFYSKHQVFGPTDYPWKVFVKSSVDFNNVKSVTRNETTNARGSRSINIKEVYEEIIGEDLKSDSSKCKVKRETVRNAPSVSDDNKSSIKKTNIAINSVFKAVEERDLTFLKSYISSDNVNITDDFGWTPLMLAAYYGHLEIVKFLLKCGANKKSREKSGLTAAQLALKKNYLDVVAFLRKEDSVVSEETIAARLRSISDQDKRLWVKNNDSHVDRKLSEKLEQKIEVYCDTCKGKFFQSSSTKHENSILHIFNSKPKLPNTFFGISKVNKGYQMLLTTGWDEESGLGPSGNGLKYPVKTVLKTDRKGLGHASIKNDARITHFKPGDINAVKSMRISRPKVMTKKDREKLLNRESRKDRALRMALS